MKKLSPEQMMRLMAARAGQMRKQENASYDEFNASQLYCPKCKAAMPVREKLLLALPGKDLFDYICTGCGESLGTKN